MKEKKLEDATPGLEVAFQLPPLATGPCNHFADFT